MGNHVLESAPSRDSVLPISGVAKVPREQRVVDYLLRLPHVPFQEFTDEDRERLAQGASIQEFCAKEVIIHQGYQSAHVYLLAEGALGVWTQDKNGNRSILHRIMVNGEFFGEVSLFRDQCLEAAPQRSANVVAKEDSILICWSSDEFRSILSSNSRVALQLIYQLSNWLHADSAWREFSQLLDHTHLVALGLAGLAERVGGRDASDVQLPNLKQEELATLFGFSRPTVSTDIQLLKAAGLLSKDRNPVVLNVEALRRYAFSGIFQEE